jgi:hypothetical protein
MWTNGKLDRFTDYKKLSPYDHWHKGFIEKNIDAFISRMVSLPLLGVF